MSRFVLLDTGPLGQLARRRPDPALILWTRRLISAGARLAISEICDYELRREFVRARLTGSLQALDSLPSLFDYLPIDTPTMRLAANLWAQVRQQGQPTADLRELDGDVILAAQAQLLLNAGHDVVVATTNIGHLSRLVPAQLWETIA
jgi:predicted nucleic acid-binding protein